MAAGVVVFDDLLGALGMAVESRRVLVPIFGESLAERLRENSHGSEADAMVREAQDVESRATAWGDG